MKKIALHWKIIIGMLLGIAWAVLSSSMGWSKFTLDWIAPFGDIFINLLKLIAVPLVLFSIISGIGSLGDTSRLGSMGMRTLGLYLVTTVLAVGLGLALSNTIQPGKFVDESARKEYRISYELWAKGQGIQLADDNCVTCDPANSALTAEVADRNGLQVQSEYVQDKMESAQAQQEEGPLQFLVDVVPSNIFVSLNDNKLMLQVIFFAIFFGVCMLLIDQRRAEPILNLVNGMNDIFLKMVDITMQYSPFFVFALMAGLISEMAGNDLGKLIGIFKGLSVYSLVILIGLGSMAYFIYPLAVQALTKGRMKYGKFLQGILPAQMLAFSTSSSAATLPETMKCVEENLGVDKEVTSFVLPIGATVNMDGTSLYQAVAVIFLAHMHDIDLSMVQQLTIVLTATLASIGAAAVPSAGIVMLMIVLQSVGLNPAWIAIILPVDRILDMCRTVVNVTGDATVSTIVNYFDKPKVEEKEAVKI